MIVREGRSPNTCTFRLTTALKRLNPNLSNDPRTSCLEGSGEALAGLRHLERLQQSSLHHTLSHGG